MACSRLAMYRPRPVPQGLTRRVTRSGAGGITRPVRPRDGSHQRSVRWANRPTTRRYVGETSGLTRVDHAGVSGSSNSPRTDVTAAWSRHSPVFGSPHTPYADTAGAPRSWSRTSLPGLRIPHPIVHSCHTHNPKRNPQTPSPRNQSQRFHQHEMAYYQQAEWQQAAEKRK